MIVKLASPILATAIVLAITVGASACEWKKQVSASASPPTDAQSTQATPIKPLTMAADEATAGATSAVVRN
jgi:hypothetical protein